MSQETLLARTSLSALRCLEATVRTGSITLAAEELHLTHGAVSRQIRKLETAVGQPLFERHGRGVHPFPATRRLALEVSETLSQLSEALQLVHDQTPPERLVLSCEPTLLIRWLIPRLPQLAAAAPDLDVQLVAGGGPVHFRRDGIDVAIRRNDFARAPGTTAVALMPEMTGPVGRPDLMAAISTPQDLLAHPLLRSRTRPGAWDEWGARAGIDVSEAPIQTFEHFYIAVEAATAGLGIAIAPRAAVLDAIDGGQLAAPCGFTADGSVYEVQTVGPARPGTQSARVIAWLTAIARESDGD